MNNLKVIASFVLFHLLAFYSPTSAQQKTKSVTAWDHNTQQYVLIDVPVDAEITGTPTVDSHGDVLGNGTAHNYSMLSRIETSTATSDGEAPLAAEDNLPEATDALTNASATESRPRHHNFNHAVESNDTEEKAKLSAWYEMQESAETFFVLTPTIVDGVTYPPTNRLYREDAAKLIHLTAKYRRIPLARLAKIFLAILSVHRNFNRDEAMILTTLLIENPAMANFETPTSDPNVLDDFLNIRAIYEKTLQQNPASIQLADRIHTDYQAVLASTDLTGSEAGPLVLSSIQGNYPISNAIRAYHALSRSHFGLDGK